MIRKIVYVNLLFISFVIMGLEMTATRIIAPSFGNSVYTWGIVISIFLVGSSGGYVLGGFLADRKRSQFYTLLFYLAGMLWIGCIPYIKSFVFPLVESYSTIPATLIAVTVLYLVPNLLFTAVTPVLMKTGLDDTVSGKVLGNLHTASALGSVFGTLVTTFWLIPMMSIQMVLVAFIGILLIPFILYFFVAIKMKNLLILLPVLFLILPLSHQESLPENVIYHTTSLYHDIYVFKAEQYYDKNGDYRYLTFGNKDTIQGAINLENPDEMVFDYANSMYDLTNYYTPKSNSLFMVGHGIGTLGRQYEKEKEKVKIAEIDSALVDISKKYFLYEGDNVVVGDGRKILNDEKSKYDVIILDAYHNTTQIPFHLTTKEFFQLTNEKLSDNGIVIMNIIGEEKNDPIVESVTTTVKTVYPYVKVFKNVEESGIQNLYLVASNKPLEENGIENLVEFPMEQGEIILDTDTKLKNLN